MARIADLRYNLSFSVTGTEELQRAQTIAQSIALDQRLLAEETKKAGIQTKTQTQAVRDGNMSLKTYVDSLYRLRNRLEQGSQGYKTITAEITRFTSMMRSADETTKRYNSTLIANQAREAARVAKMKDATTSADLLKARSASLISTMGQETSISARASLEYEKLNREYDRAIANLSKMSNMVGITRSQKAKLLRDANALRNEQAKLNNAFGSAGVLYRNTSSSLESLSADFRLLDANVRANRISTEQAERELKSLIVALDIAEGTILDMGKSAGLSSAQIAELKNELARVRQQATQTARDIRGVSNAFTGTTKATNSANQLMLSFGDIAQDSAQFSFGFAQGMRAIGNNITFAAEQYSILALKVADATGRTATFADTLKFLRSSLGGINGLIFLLNIVVTTVTIFAQRQSRLNREVREGADAIEEMFGALSKFKAGDIEFNLTENILFDLESLRFANQRIQELTKSIESNIRASSGGRGGSFIISKQNSDAVKDFTKDIRTLESTREAIISQYPSLLNLDEQQLQKFLELNKEQADQIAFQETQLGLFKDSVRGGTEYLRIFDEITRVSQDLTLAEAQRELGLQDLAITEDEARVKLERLKDEMIRAGLSSQMTESLILKLADAQKSLAKSTDEATEAMSAQYDERTRMIRQLADMRLREPVLELELRIKQTDTGTEAGIQQVRDLRMQQLELESSMTLMSEAEIALKKFEINKEYEDNLRDLRMAYMNDYMRMQQESYDSQLQLSRQLADAQNQINSQLVTSVGNMFSAMISSRKAGSLLMLAVEKGLAIAGVISQSQDRINELQVERNKNLGMAASLGILGSPMAAQYTKAAGALQGAIASVKVSRNKSIAKIAAIGLLQGIAGAGGDSAGGGGGAAGGAGGATTTTPFGFSQTEIEGPQTFRTPGFIPTAPMGAGSGAPIVEILADRKSLYYIVKMGEEEYREIQA